MKVCLASCVARPDDTRNGNFIRYLETRSELEIYAVFPGRPISAFSSRVKYIALPEQKHFFFYASGLVNLLLAAWKRIWNTVALAECLLKIRPAICWVSEPDSWLVAVLAKRVFGCKVVADLKEVYEDRALAFPRPFRTIVRKLLRGVMGWLSRYTDQIIHVSHERQRIYSYLRQPGTVVGNYPELSQFRIEFGRGLSKSSTLDEKLTVIHAGALRSTYAAESLLEAMMIVRRELPGLKLVALGGISGRLQDTRFLEQLIQDGTLQLTPRVPFEGVVQWLLRSDIGISLVLPVDTGHYLAQPRKLYEYLAAGLPVIAADVPTLREVITKWECGLLVDATSPREIAFAMGRLARDADLRQRFGQKARKAAETNFNWEGEVKRLHRVADELMRDRATQPPKVRTLD